VEYAQLVKLDECNPDAVMEQLFGIVDTLLMQDAEARRRQLCVRTYSVVPLAQNVGVLEFVTNTKPLADLLKNRHTRYGRRRKDWTSQECRKKTGGVQRVIQGQTKQAR